MKCNYASVVAVISVFAHDKLVDQHNKLHPFGPKDALEFVVPLFVVALQILHNDG
jgi:hypothetical protein